MFNRHERGAPKGGLIRKGIRGLAGGVGLASEGIKAHKEGKAAEKESMSRTASDTSSHQGDDFKHPSGPHPSHIQGHITGAAYDKDSKDKSADEVVEVEPESLEQEWNLDDAQDEVYEDAEKPPGYDSLFTTMPSTSDVKLASEEELEDQFLRKHPIPQDLQNQPRPSGRLPLTVVLPQRRPKDRSRGFIRAYAPVLENCGIDQTTWLSFLDTFQKSSAANPWLNAINMAQFATFALPTPIGLAVGYAIAQITNAAIELQSRERYVYA